MQNRALLKLKSKCNHYANLMINPKTLNMPQDSMFPTSSKRIWNDEKIGNCIIWYNIGYKFIASHLSFVMYA
jgi:hypothetical protein